MNSRLARLLTRLYPRAWRQRYGDEFAAHLEMGRGDLSTAANVVCSAIRARILPGEGLAMNQNLRSGGFQSWCVRAPWAIFSLGPLLLLAGAYLIACIYLWIGWKIFLPAADTPFGTRLTGPIYGLENLYFQAGKFYYFAVPVLVGWGTGLLAARQRIKAAWPVAGLALIAWLGASVQVHASRTQVPQGLGHISMNFAPGTSLQGIAGSLLHALVIFSLTVLPWILWRFHKDRSLAA